MAKIRVSRAAAGIQPKTALLRPGMVNLDIDHEGSFGREPEKAKNTALVHWPCTQLRPWLHLLVSIGTVLRYCSECRLALAAPNRLREEPGGNMAT
jgi:hypothetical protein